MLYTCGDGEDFRSRNDQPVLNGILVTPDDLYDSRKTSSNASTSLYVKPLTSESRDGGNGIQNRDHRDRSSGPMNKANRILESVNRGSFVHDGLRDTTHQRTNLQNFSKPNMRTASPAFSRMHRSSFKRDSAVRRSLGGTAIPPSWLNEDPLSVYDTSRTHVSQTPSAHSPSKPNKDILDLDLAPLLHIRVVRLPSLDDLGFSLDSYSHPSTGHFLGLRLCDRFQSRKIHFEARDNCPFEAGDLIVSVNQHRLSSMHESQAIRYVCNAFRDARQYTVEFGVFRLPHASEKTSSARSPQKQYYEPSTLPNRTSHAKRFSTAYQLETVHVADAKEVEATQHQPRRVQPSRNSIVSESVGIPNSPRRSYYNQVSPARLSASVESADTSTLSGAPTPPPRLASSPLLCVNRSSDSANKSYGNEIYPVASPSTQPSGSVRGRASARSGFGASSSLRIHRRSCSGVALKDMNAFNTKAIGQRISIELNKVADGGLGFTLTRRDTQTNPEGNDPVYVKKILPTGAAVQDGRLLIGDRLLSVDGIDVCNLDQVLTQLRAVPAGRTVHLLVSRQVASQVDDLAMGRKSALPSVSQSAEDPDLNSVDLPPRPFRSFTFEFRLPTNLSGVSGKPTLGVNFKWNTFPPDLDESTASMYAPLPGLYVESLLPDGLVIQAERPTLLPGDRLVGLNGDSLDGLGAKEISTKIKGVLSTVEKSGPEKQNAERFSLTVHRYRGLHRLSGTNAPRASIRNRRSMVASESSDQRDPLSSDRYANAPFLTDNRRRRSSLIEGAPDRSFLSVTSSSSAEGNSRHSTSSPRYLSVPPRMFSGTNPYFDREGFGRRSVSEKRHGQVDAAQLPFFQSQILPNRYKMPEDVDKQYSTMPTTRRLKIHRERLAALAVSNSGIASAGPIKALHPSALLSGSSDPKTGEASLVQSISNQPNRDDTTPPSEPSANRFKRGRKQNSSFRNAVDRSLTLGKPLSDPIESTTGRLGRSRSASRVTVTSTITAEPIASEASETDRLRNLSNRTTDSQHPARFSCPTSPTGQPDACPPVPPRQEALPARTTPQCNAKSTKRSFGGIRGLFRFVSGKSSQSDKSTDDRSPCTNKPFSNPPLNRRLSVPDHRLISSPPASITNTPTTRTATKGTLIPTKSSPMQIPFKETYYIIRSPSRSNEPVPTAPADNVTTRPINHHARSHKRSEPHITPKKSTSSSKYHRETEESISEPRAPPTAPPVPPRKHRNDIPQKASPLAVLNNRQSQPSDSRHNGQHRSGWNEPDRSHTRANRSPREAVSNPHGDPIPLSTYHQTVLHSVPKNHHSAEVHGRHRSHRSSKHAVPVCPIRSYPDSIPIYENNRLRHVTQRKSESHVHSGPDSTKPNLPAQTNKKDPTSPIKSNRSTVISPNVLATPLKITPRATGSSSHSSSRRKRCAVDPEAILVVENAPSTASHRTVQVVPTAGRRSQHTNETNHRRRRSPSRNGH